MRWLAFLVSSIALVAAGCGGGSSESAATTETAATETTTTESTSTESTSTDTSASTTGATFDWTSKDCQNMAKAFVGLGAAVAAASTGQDVSSDIQQFGKYVDEVPDEIQADVKTIASAYDEFVAKLKDIGYTPGQVPTADQIQQLQDASQSVGDPAVRAASDRLNAWTTKNCT
jgi:hypothetical protein